MLFVLLFVCSVGYFFSSLLCFFFLSLFVRKIPTRYVSWRWIFRSTFLSFYVRFSVCSLYFRRNANRYSLTQLLLDRRKNLCPKNEKCKPKIMFHRYFWLTTIFVVCKPWNGDANEFCRFLSFEAKQTSIRYPQFPPHARLTFQHRLLTVARWALRIEGDVESIQRRFTVRHIRVRKKNPRAEFYVGIIIFNMILVSVLRSMACIILENVWQCQ